MFIWKHANGMEGDMPNDGFPYMFERNQWHSFGTLIIRTLVGPECLHGRETIARDIAKKSEDSQERVWGLRRCL